MDFNFGKEQQGFRNEIKDFCQREISEELLKEVAQKGEALEHYPEVYRKFAERGWIGLQFPKEYGGQGRSRIDMVIFLEEMQYAGIPTGNYISSVVFIGESILAFGTEEQKRWFLPRIISGELNCSFLLTEPNAGTDAASIQLTAVEEEDEYVLNGEKLFNSGTGIADYAMLAARTDPSVPKHKGISLFLIPLNSPGITIRPQPLIGEIVLYEEFFDNVRVPKSSMLGGKNKGWQNLMQYTLNFERASIGRIGVLRRSFDALIEYIKSSGLSIGESSRYKLAEIKARMHAVRWLAYRTAWMLDEGLTPIAESSIVKLAAFDLQFDLANVGMDILGHSGVLKGLDAPVAGMMEREYMVSAANKIGGATPEVQRMVIAQHGLGLPR